MAASMDNFLSMIQDIFDGIKIISGPSKSTQRTDLDSSPDWFWNSLIASLRAFHETLEDGKTFKHPEVILGGRQASLKAELSTSDDKKWTYVNHCLVLLDSLRSCLHDAVQVHKDDIMAKEATQKTTLSPNMAPVASPDTLSFAQHKLLSTLLQFIVSLGICSALLKGVGLPLSVRSTFGAAVSSEKPLPFRERQRRLMLILRTLTSCIEQPVLGGFILSKNLNDMLASLIQVACTKDIQKTIKIRKPDGSLISPVDTEVLSPEDIQFSQAKLNHLTQNSYQPSVIKELLMLQGGALGGVRTMSAPLPKPPTWLRKVSGRLLTERLIASKGVSHFLQGVLDVGEESVTAWSRCDAIAGLLAACPTLAILNDVYYKHICPQLLDLLHSVDPLHGGKILRVISSCLVAMVASETILARRYLLDPLFGPLVIGTRPPGACDNECVLANEDELAQCMDAIHKVCVTGRSPNSNLSSVLIPILQPIFFLYCFAKEGVCNLRIPSEDILTSFLQTADLSCAVAALEHMSGVKQHSNHGTLHDKVTFTPGSCGGAVMVYQANASVEELFTQQLMRHEHTGGCCTALLLAARQEKLIADFFISVLDCMTETVASLDAQDQATDHASLHSRQLGTSTALLDLEPDSKEDKIKSVQHALRVLAVLEQMCESLGPEHLKKTSHMLRFCLAALQRGCNRLRREEEMGVEGEQGEGEGSVPGILETETLTLAIALLSAISTGESRKKLEPADKKILQEILPLLQTIKELHSAEPIQQLAEDLAIAIATHGTVSSEFVRKAAKNVKTEESRAKPAKSKVGANGIENAQKSVSKQNGELKNRQTNTDEALTGMKADSAKLHRTSQGSDTVSKSVNEFTMEEVVDSKRLQQLNIAKEADSVQLKELKSKSPHVTVLDELDTESNTHNKALTQLDRVGVQSRTVDNDLKENYEMVRKDAQVRESNDIPAKMDENEPKISDGQNSARKESPSSTAFDEAFSELSDPLLPVRGHALIALSRLVKEKDPKALDKSETLLGIFEEHLTDEDSYIYLPSINGLVALANVHPDRVLPHLCLSFTSSHADPGKLRSEVRQERSVEKTLKLGEALVRATRQLGELTPHYREQLLNTIMAGARHYDPSIRASSLAHLGQVCQLLRYSVGPIIHEVMECVTSSIKHDPELEVKRSAVQVINLLLKGLGKDAMQVLETTLRGIYRCLRDVASLETDDILRLHAQLGLEEMDVIMRGYLFPEQTLSKKITVLHP